MDYFIRAYLRASTDDQDATRAKNDLLSFVKHRDLRICKFYTENESGAKLHRPELFNLIEDCNNDDVLLIEDVDRLSRLNAEDWETLKSKLAEKHIRIVAVNVPTTWHQLSTSLNEFDARMFGAINSMLLDMLAAIARRDFEQRRHRQAQGIKRARGEGKYVGRKPDIERYKTIKKLIDSNVSWSEIQSSLKCSKNTISAALRFLSKPD